MAQKTSWNAAALTESDINTYLMGEGGAWTSWTPTVTQSGSVTVTNTRSRYARYGRTIHFSLSLSVTGSGTSTNAVLVSTPVTAAASTLVIGTGWINDTSASTYYGGVAYLASTTTIALLPSATNANGVALGQTGAGFSAGLASGDLINISGTFEAAS